MPIDGSSTELLNNNQSSNKKKRSHKKRRHHHRKSHSKARLIDPNDLNNQSVNGIKTALNTNRTDLNKLTPANLASLRWDNPLTDDKLETERIERYKELRRQRYANAREHAIQTILDQMRLASMNTINDPSTTLENDRT